MNLIEIQKKVEQKDRERNKLLGQKSMLIDNLKKLGFKNLGEAKKKLTALTNEIKKMEKGYQADVATFQEKFEALL